MFETERLILRPFAERDIDLVLNLWNDPDVQRGATNEYLLPRSPAFKEKLREWVRPLPLVDSAQLLTRRSQADKALFYVIITLKTNGEFLGNVTLDVSSPKDRDGTLSITLSKKYWGNGYGREILKFTLDYAFKSLGLHRVSLEVIESNVRAVKLYTTMCVLWFVPLSCLTLMSYLKRFQGGRKAAKRRLD